ncbi:unnamed protein product [Dovyalis caffra]|uniref:Uncharacterized protein n=1 Tax=Dovyalis caffra TaxID=77055 RepID=A0AAV1RNM0_9ROSI|nr:unnamed protein product [Dovyalis caffra]
MVAAAKARFIGDPVADNLKKFCTDLVRGTRDKRLRVKGPVRIANKKINQKNTWELNLMDHLD